MKDQAAASTTAFLFAGVLFMAAVGSVLVTTGEVGQTGATSQQQAVLYTAQAEALRDVLVYSAGSSSKLDGSAVDWLKADPEAGKKAPDRLTRLGLRNDTDSFISFDKLENLRRAPYAKDATDGFANYEEAREAMGLDELGLDFHIRAHPSLRSVQELLDSGVRDPNLRVTYIGDALTANQQQIANGGSVPSVTTPTCVLGPDGKSLRLASTIGNTGSAATAFHVVFTIEFGNKAVEDTTRGPVVASGASTSLWVDVAAKSGRDCDDVTKVKVAVYDPTSEQVLKTFTPSHAGVSPATGVGDFRVDPDRVAHTTVQDVVITFAGELTATKNNAVGETLTLSVWQGATDRTSDLSVPATLEVPKQNQPWVFPAFPAMDLGAGTYEIRLARSNGQVSADQLIIVASSPGSYAPTGSTTSTESYAFSDAAKTEAAFLEALVHRFCPYDWNKRASPPIPTGSWDDRCNPSGPGTFPAHSAQKDTIGQDGDIFPDDKKLLGDQLHKRLQHTGGAARLDIVNTLVVGSNVDHNTMTSEAVKGSIEKWVLGGGTLMVFGSEKQTVQWLQSIFKASIDSSNGGIGTPDQNHPMLHVADELAWDAYDHQGRAWDLKQNGNHNKNITRVVEDENGNSILAISDPGAYGDGTVIVTSWLPYDLFGTGSASADCQVNAQGCALMNNLLMQGYRDLFLDYGPEIPNGVLSVPAPAVAQVYHPELGRAVALDIEVFVFPRQ